MRKNIAAILTILVILSVLIPGCSTSDVPNATTETATVKATPDVILPQTPGPMETPGDSEKAIFVTAGCGMYAAITDSGGLYMWDNDQPTPIKYMEDVKSVSLGGQNKEEIAMVLKNDGTLYMWGSNSFVFSGLGVADSVRNAVLVMEDIAYIDAGLFNALAVTTSGDLYVWGSNEFGQVGAQSMRDQYAAGQPTLVMSDVVSASATMFATLAATTDGALYGWGFNETGLLNMAGPEPEQYQNFVGVPVILPVKLMDGVEEVVNAIDWGAALTKDGELLAWDRTTAEPVSLMNGVREIFEADGMTFVLDENGAIFAAGYIGSANLTTKQVLENMVCATIGYAVDANGNLISWNGDLFADELQIETVAVVLNPDIQPPLPEPVYAFDMSDANISLCGGNNRTAFADGEVVYALLTGDMKISRIELDTGMLGTIGLNPYPDDGELVCMYDDYIYYTHSDSQFGNYSLERVSLDGLDRSTVFLVTEDFDIENEYAWTGAWQVGQYLYYCYDIVSNIYGADRNDPEIDPARLFRFNLVTGEEIEMDSAGIWPSKTFLSDGQYIYYLDYEQDRQTFAQYNVCYRVDQDWGNKTEVFRVEENINLKLLNNGHLYYIMTTFGEAPEDVTESLWSVGIDGQDMHEITAIDTYNDNWDYGDPEFVINAAEDYVYFTDVNAGYTLWRIRTDGADLEQISQQTGIESISIAAGRVFCGYRENLENGMFYGTFSVMPDGSDMVVLKDDRI